MYKYFYLILLFIRIRWKIKKFEKVCLLLISIIYWGLLDLFEYYIRFCILQIKKCKLIMRINWTEQINDKRSTYQIFVIESRIITNKNSNFYKSFRALQGVYRTDHNEEPNHEIWNKHVLEEKEIKIHIICKLKNIIKIFF